MSNPIDVAVLGATGTVGQKFLRLLDGHPLFRVAELVASERSAGKAYESAVSWKQETSIPQEVRSLVVKDLSESLESTILFSGLDSSVAGEAETRYAEAGHVVISNSSNHRMDRSVPLIIPEVNPDHFGLIAHQSGPGAIITNSNCSTMFLAMVLAISRADDDLLELYMDTNPFVHAVVIMAATVGRGGLDRYEWIQGGIRDVDSAMAWILFVCMAYVGTGTAFLGRAWFRLRRNPV